MSRNKQIPGAKRHRKRTSLIMQRRIAEAEGNEGHMKRLERHIKRTQFLAGHK